METPVRDKGPNEIDYVVVRDNTGGIYTGIGGIQQKGTPHEVAVQANVYNRQQVDRCLRWAFEYAQKYGKKTRGVGKENGQDSTGFTLGDRGNCRASALLGTAK